MASKSKHMARSHRGYGKNYNVFNSFAYRADVIKNRKEASKSMTGTNIADKLNNAFNSLKTRFRKAQGK